MTSRVTIQDIAAAAGVSRQTVTRAMNGMPRISEVTRAKVQAISEELGYRPSRFASNLARSSKDKTIGIVVESFRNPYYSELTADLVDAAARLGWQLTISSHETERVLPLVSRLAGEVDALVGYFGNHSEEELLAAARGVPMVLLGSRSSSPGAHSVDIDFTHGFSSLIRELSERGAHRFGMLESHAIGVPYQPSGRRIAYESTVDDESRRAVVICDALPQSIDAGELGFHQLMDQFPETDTVIAFSDLMAMGALRAAHRRGLDIPGAVRIIGIDGSVLGAVTSPALTSLAFIGEAFTEAIVEVLRVALGGAAPTSEHRLVTPSILWRESA